MNLTANGVTVPITATSIAYTNTNYLPLGSSSSTEYAVVQGTPTIPTTAVINDTGTAYTANRYTSSAKTTLLGTDVVTYALVADTATTGLLKVTHTYKNTGGAMTMQDTLTLRITPTGSLTYVNETVLDLANNQNLTITY